MEITNHSVRDTPTDSVADCEIHPSSLQSTTHLRPRRNTDIHTGLRKSPYPRPAVQTNSDIDTAGPRGDQVMRRALWNGYAFRSEISTGAPGSEACKILPLPRYMPTWLTGL